MKLGDYKKTMLERLIAQDEGKTPEFKANARPLMRIIKTVVAFANTAGGTLVIGVQDGTKDVLGIKDPLQDEERLASVLAESIRPQLLPDIQICAWRERQLVVITVPHMVGPYFVASEGVERGVYVRLGSTNRRAEPEMIRQIQLLASNSSFDEQPWTEGNSEAIDFRAASELFAQASRKLTLAKRRSLGPITQLGNRTVPSVGAVLLFGSDRNSMFPDVAVREAVINAVVHADYSLTGMGVKVGIFDDRIEITSASSLFPKENYELRHS